MFSYRLDGIHKLRGDALTVCIVESAASIRAVEQAAKQEGWKVISIRNATATEICAFPRYSLVIADLKRHRVASDTHRAEQLRSDPSTTDSPRKAPRPVPTGRHKQQYAVLAGIAVMVGLLIAATGGMFVVGSKQEAMGLPPREQLEDHAPAIAPPSPQLLADFKTFAEHLSPQLEKNQVAALEAAGVAPEAVWKTSYVLANCTTRAVAGTTAYAACYSGCFTCKTDRLSVRDFHDTHLIFGRVEGHWRLIDAFEITTSYSDNAHGEVRSRNGQRHSLLDSEWVTHAVQAVPEH